ncbi:MAG: hypothetical protein PHE20_02615 [Patescibacteria group bacterium]|nr:hypothetical protein [Patescibacteria group bacterium]
MKEADKIMQSIEGVNADFAADLFRIQAKRNRRIKSILKLKSKDELASLRQSFKNLS